MARSGVGPLRAIVCDVGRGGQWIDTEGVLQLVPVRVEQQIKERLAAGSVWEDHGLVFASTIGTPMEPRNVNRRFEELRRSAGLDWRRLHDLRHAFATFLLDQGEELRTVMELLGHSTIRLTADTYGHVLPARAREATGAIDRLLGTAGES